MSDRINIEGWLVAEREGSDAAAERALRQVFGALPSAVPSAGFSGRVLASVALGQKATVFPWWSRAAIAACLLLAGLAAALILPLVLALIQVIAPGEAIGALVQSFVALFSRVDELLTLWRVWARIVDIALVIVSAPPVVLSLLTLTVLSAFTFRGLKQALVTHRSPDHVAAC